MTRDEAEAIAQKRRETTTADASGRPPVWTVDAVLDAADRATAAERQRCAALCRKLQVESRTRIELGYVCARAILGEGDG